MAHAQLSPETEFLIDFNLHCVPAALGLDVPPAAAAAMMDITKAQFLDYAAEVDVEVRQVAESLLADPETARAVSHLAVPADGTMMTLGDSITTWRRSYARLLEAMVSIARPNDGIRFLNVAQSGYTSTHALETVHSQFIAAKPDWVSIKFGVNDCKIFGGAGGKTLVSLEEYRANLSGVVEAFLKNTPARPVLFTPVPVVEEVVNATPEFQAMQMTWNNTDVLARADAVRELSARHGLPLVDLVEAFGDSPDPALYLDGLHPGPAGHKLILAALCRTLSTS